MNEELRQQLWDLLYGLLEPEEAAALKARITSEPEVARLYADICLQRELVADAARVEIAPLSLVPPGGAVSQPVKSHSLAATSRPKKSRNSASRSWANGVVALAAAVLFGIVATALWQRPEATPIAEIPDIDVTRPLAPAAKPSPSVTVITEVRGPATIVPGMTNHFSLQARTADDQPVVDQWNLRLVDQTGAERFAVELATDATGVADIEIPGTALRASGTLLVERDNSFLQEFSFPLNVAAESLAAHLKVDRPIARPGETVGFRTVVLGEQSLAIRDAVAAEFELFDAEGTPVPGTRSTELTHLGVAAADAILPSNTPDGIYELAVRSPDGAFAEQRTRLVVQRDGAAGFLAQKDADRDSSFYALRGADKLEVASANSRMLASNGARFEESTEPRMGLSLLKEAGNEVSAGGARREKQKLRNPQAKQDGTSEAAAAPLPAAPAASIADQQIPPPGAAEPKNQSSPSRKGNAEKAAPLADLNKPGNSPAQQAGGSNFGGGVGGGLGSMEPKPEDLALGEKFGSNELQSAFGLQVVADTRDGLILELPAQASAAGQLRISNEQGEVLAQADVPAAEDLMKRKGNEDAKRGTAPPRQVEISLPPEVSGPLFLSMVDPNQPDQQQLTTVWERPAQRWAELTIDAADENFSVGQEVELQLTSRSEAGQPLASVLGVRIINEDLAQWMESDETDANRKGDAVESEALARKRYLRREVDALASDSQIEKKLANSAVEGAGNNDAPAAGEKRASASNNYVKARPHLVVLGRNEFSAPPKPPVASYRDEKMQSAQDFQLEADQLSERDCMSAREQAQSLLHQRFVARVLLAAGLLGLMAVGVACMLRISLRPWASIPALAAAFACIVLGAYRLPIVSQATSQRVATNSPNEKVVAQHRPAKPEEALPETQAAKSMGSAVDLEHEQAELLQERAKPTADKVLAADNVQPANDFQRKSMKEELRTAEEQPAGTDGKGVAAAPTSVPVTLFWNPRLVTNDEGQATIRFQLPPQGGRYRVVVEAHADGRLGQAEKLIVSQQTQRANAAAPAPAEPAPAAVDANAPASPAAPSAEAAPQP